MNSDTRSDKQLNRIIGEWCGWANVRDGFGEVIRYAGTESEVTITGLPIPDYTGDLNACHEAEGKLDGIQKNDFAMELWNLVLPNNFNLICGTVYEDELYAIAHATARQRAEALVKVIEQQKGQG